MPKLNPRRVPVRRREPSQRAHSFEEIELGYSLDEARAEAERCLLCPAQPCVAACPAGNHIPDVLGALRDGRLEEAAQVLRRTSAFPALCSRLCDHVQQCEGACVVGRRGDAVAIGRLERFVADWERSARRPACPAAGSTGRRVAIVGAGPCGMAAAGLLAKCGHEVHVIDALPAIGGVLAWGIPRFRLPDDVLGAETGRLLELGVAFHGDVRLGGDLSLDGLFQRGFQAILLATGAPSPVLLRLPGSDLPGVVTATEFLTAAKLGGQRRIGRRVVVIGGGNTAMDAAGTALRLGAAEVTVLYRRSRAEIPARQEELQAVEEEGVSFRFLVAPLAFVPDARGRLARVRCCPMALGTPGADGRPVAVPVAGQDFELEADAAVLALGFDPDAELRAELQDVQLDRRGYIVADPASGRTSRPGVWAGGDVVSGPATVVGAMAAGLRAARDMDRYLMEEVRYIEPALDGGDRASVRNRRLL